MEKNFDFGIIGAGPAGFTAALLAAEKGYSVVLFEKEHIGGTCLNKGCIPTKTILHSADLYKDIKNAENIGIITNELNFDFSKLMEHKNKVVEGFTKKYNVDKLVYYETTDSIELAIKREKQLKNWHRQWKINLIKENNPDFRDLSLDWE